MTLHSKLMIEAHKLRSYCSDILVGVRSSASPAVFGRKDFDPVNKHKFAFTIFTNVRYIKV